MRADVTAKAPEEACGIVAGEENHSKLVVPVTNTLHDAYRFRMDPDEQLKAMLLVEKLGMEILAIYHSHPQGIQGPSATDFDELTFPGVIYLIWYQLNQDWSCRGYLMRSRSDMEEVQVVVST